MASNGVSDVFHGSGDKGKDIKPIFPENNIVSDDAQLPKNHAEIKKEFNVKATAVFANIMMADNKEKKDEILNKGRESCGGVLAYKIVNILKIDDKYAQEILDDPKFQEIFKQLSSVSEKSLLDTTDSRQNRKEKSHQRLEAQKALIEYVKNFAKSHNVQFDEKVFSNSLRSFVNYQGNLMVASRLAGSSKMSPEDKIAFNQKIEDIMDRLNKGDITDDEAQKEIDKLIRDNVKENGDEELKRMLSRKDEMNSHDELGEYPVDDQEEMMDAMNDVKDIVSGTGFDFTIVGENEANMQMTSDFYLNVSIYKKPDGEFAYYLADKYSNDGRTGPFTADKLLDAFDQRHLDGFLTQRLMPFMESKDELYKIKDEKIVLLSEKIIGEGKNRGYVVDGENKKMLETLVKVLATPDEKYLTVNDKIEKLVGYETGWLNKKENAEILRRKLRTGRVEPLSSMMV